MLNIHKINAVINGRFLLQYNNAGIKHILLDSRKVRFTQNAIFFAIVGKNHNGHYFVEELYQQGVRNFVVSQPINIHNLPLANVIEVANTLTALQMLAAYHRQQFTIPVIGITGSNGKTIVKEWLHQLLFSDYKIVRNPKSYNSQVGVPLSVWQINATHNLGIFEAGISTTHEMQQLSQIVQANIGIFTNIGSAHSRGFTNIEEKAAEKALLFTKSKYVIYCADYLAITKALQLVKTQYKPDLQLLAWRNIDSKLPQSPYLRWLVQIVVQKNRSIINFYKPKQQHNISNSYYLAFTDKASIENAIHCICLLLQLGYSPQTINNRLSKLSTVEMRLELKAGINHCTIINDAYNSDLNALQIALDFLLQQQQHPKKTVILSDIIGSDYAQDSLYQRVANFIHQAKIDKFIGIGSNILAHQQYFTIKEAYFFSTTQAFLQQLPSFSNESILIKGARNFAFEKIVQQLSQKIHSTILSINLNAITHNLMVYRSFLKPSTKIMVMVKSLSYGSGSYEIANHLQFNKLDYLAVAYTDEGVALRKAGIQLPIMVLNPTNDSFYQLLKYNLEPEVYSINHLKQLINFIQSAQYHTAPVAVHLNLDTGMHRLGFEWQHLAQLLNLLKKNAICIKVKSIFTHLAASDSDQFDDFSLKQIATFEQMRTYLSDIIQKDTLIHALNSTGIARFAKQAQYDMVRLGLGLYGFDASSNIQHLLQNVSSLTTHIAQIKTIAKGETIGYGRKGIADTDKRIATVNIGYGDGLSRSLSNGVGKMYINGYFAPIIGNVCMDMCMLDISDLPNKVKEGDKVEVFGNHQSVNDIAQSTHTIAYEVLTNISERVKRIYYYD